MTYRELWEKNHPGECWLTEHVCPNDLNGVQIECPGNKVATCIDCWDREIPEETDIFEAAKKICESALKTSDAFQNAAKALADSKKQHTERHNEPTIKDSGDRTQFESGAVRDMREGKGRCDLMPLEVVADLLNSPDCDHDPIIYNIARFKRGGGTSWLKIALWDFATSAYSNYRTTMLLEVAKHFEEGAKKYGENNWQKGIPVKCYIDSAVRHYLKWLRGDKDEPHDRAFVWNLMCCIWEVDYHKEEKE